MILIDPKDISVLFKSITICKCNSDPELANQILKEKDNKKLIAFAKDIVDGIIWDIEFNNIPGHSVLECKRFVKQLKAQFFVDVLKEWSASQI